MFTTEQVKREVGQHFVLGFHGYDVNKDVESLIKDYFLGSIILMKRNVKERLSLGVPDVEQVASLVRKLQSFAKEAGHARPLLIGIDQENGLVSAFSSPTAGTQFPGAMAIAATGDVQLAESISETCGNELKYAGINWAFSPVADVNSDPRNPVIGVRSFGDKPGEVGRFACAVSRGLTSAGIAPSAKHFPGHGDTHVDSHLALPRILKDKKALYATELVPFQELIQSKVSSIMTGHMALPLITGDETPSSMSRIITTDLLRGELNYAGVIVTDCLEMDAIADPAQGGCGVEEGAIRATEAGADIIMICHTLRSQVGAIEGVYGALRDGRLSLEPLMTSGKRVDSLKQALGCDWNTELTSHHTKMDWQTNKEKNLQLSQKAYDKSTAVIWNQDGAIPLTKGGNIWLFTPIKESVNKAVDDDDGIGRTADGIVRNTAGASYLAFCQSIEKRAAKCKHIVYAPGETFGHLVGPEECDGIIFVMRNADRGLWQRSYLESLATTLGNRGFPVVIVASCGPYDLDTAPLKIKTGYIATFEFTSDALEAASRVIFGESNGVGIAPVDLR